VRATVNGTGISATNLSGTNTGDQDLSGKADKATTYTETEVDGLLDAKADQATTYTETQVDGLLDDKANISGQIFTGEISYRGAGGGTTNTAYGENVLENNTTGGDNTANGRAALAHNITGSDNTANGRAALAHNITGSDNTANGRSALFNNTTGGDNTAYGRAALARNITGSDNTANGRSALFNNTTGDNNTACGYDSGTGIETGSGNSIFGANVTGLAPDLTDNLILASGGVIRLQHDGVGTTTVQGDLVADNLSGTNTGDGVLAIGVGQTWQDVTGSRAQNTNYTNTTGKPIFVSIALVGNEQDVDAVTVDGVGVGSESGVALQNVQFIVPDSSVYCVNNAGFYAWTELR